MKEARLDLRQAGPEDRGVLPPLICSLCSFSACFPQHSSNQGHVLINKLQLKVLNSSLCTKKKKTQCVNVSAVNTPSQPHRRAHKPQLPSGESSPLGARWDQRNEEGPAGPKAFHFHSGIHAGFWASLSWQSQVKTQRTAGWRGGEAPSKAVPPQAPRCRQTPDPQLLTLLPSTHSPATQTRWTKAEPSSGLAVHTWQV